MNPAVNHDSSLVAGGARRYRNHLTVNGMTLKRRIPNAETIEAMRELEEGRGVRYPDAFAMLADLGIALDK